MKIDRYFKFKLERVKVLQKLGYIFDEDVILKSKHVNMVKVELKDSEGYKYYTATNNTAKGCPPLRFNPSNPFALENANNYLKLNGIKLKAKEIINMKKGTDIVCNCVECGNEFRNDLFYIVRSNKVLCNECSKKIKTESMMSSLEEVKSAIVEKGFKMLDDYYYGIHNPINIKDDFGYKYRMYLSAIKTCTMTYPFIDSNPHTIDNIKNYIRINNINSELISEEYKGSTDYLLWRCECGDIFEATLIRFRFGNQHRCRKCSGSMSINEYKVKRFLEDVNINHTTQFTFNNCRGEKNMLPFDFAILDCENKLKGLIEVDGRQHFEITKFSPSVSDEEAELDFYNLKINDAIKNAYCENNGINLLRIPYWEFYNNSEEFKESINNFINI